MNNQLILHEIKRTFWFSGLTFLVVLGFCLMEMRLEPVRALLGLLGLDPGPFRSVPFLDPNLLHTLLVVGGALVLALISTQVVRPILDEGFVRLFTLPISVGGVLVIKLLVGVAMLLASLLIPIGLCGLWADSEGTHPSPFEWSMIEGHLQVLLSLLPVYFGLILAALWPWSWFSRGFILATTAMAAIAMANIPWFLPWGVLLNGVICLGFAVVILWVAEHRDY